MLLHHYVLNSSCAATAGLPPAFFVCVIFTKRNTKHTQIHKISHCGKNVVSFTSVCMCVKIQVQLHHSCTSVALTYSVCDHLHLDQLVLGSVDVITVEAQIYKPVVHPDTKLPISYSGYFAK